MKHFIAFFLFLSGTYSYAQSDSLVSYKDMIVDSQNIYALSNTGKLTVWNLSTLNKQLIDNDTITYTAIAMDRNGIIHLGSKTGYHATFDSESAKVHIESKLKYNNEVHFMFFNSQNKMFLIYAGGIYDPEIDKYWNKFKNRPNGLIVKRKISFLLFSVYKTTNVYFITPQYAFMDSNGVIWMGKMCGEFGSMFYAFDCEKSEIIDVSNFVFADGLSFQSIFEDDNHNIYITSGLQHIGNSGEIYKIDNKNAVTLFDFIKVDDKLSDKRDLFIGPGAYSNTEQKLYFATQAGIYCTTVPNEGSINENELELLFSPQLGAVRENHAMGMKMAVKKMLFTRDNKLVFLTAVNGIGLYNGDDYIMLK
ncbi:hypothetical protein [Flavobacterium sp. C4GT6]|uniref:hypothetical protein n=1 Tax=Flavobacterium sp. C4GT6 TaxID=3103818 RepID=UPI002ED03B13